jgi:hypothetical protein
MKSSNRFLLGFGIAIAALIALTVTLVLVTHNQKATTYSENTPEGVVQRFLQAMQDKDYPKAFHYMKVTGKGTTLTYTDWLLDVQNPYRGAENTWRATLGESTISGDTATIEVIIEVFQPGGPFGNPVNSQTIVFNLTKIDGLWFITTRPAIWWFWY